ncbi:MAG: hypothetical protein JSR77_00620 [Planctomycetes bacterium]|nr:hypothetical protein [Planctomycetota bacterium]
MQREWFIAAGLLVVLLIAQEVGYRAGMRSRARTDSRETGQIGAVQAAVLGLLGLLLGFSFSGASNRFLERQDLITSEANAIGTAYLRADLLDEPHRTDLREGLRKYTEHRLRVSQSLRRGIGEADVAQISNLHNAIWKAAAEGANAKPVVALAVLPPVNDVIDVHSLRVYSGMKHLPVLVMVLLIGSSVLAIGVMAYGTGLAGKRHFMLHSALALLIGVALWTTIDLDHPRAGLLKLSDEPLAALRFDASPPSR